jgi:rod shape-determining protein MreD
MNQSLERPIAVYRVSQPMFWLSLFTALLLQTFVPLLLPLARLFDLPLLAVIYFALLKRNRVFGTLLGMGVGLLQDALSHGYIGMFGMAKALVGYMAAWGSVKFNLEHTLPRFFLTGSLILVHSLILVGLRLALLEVPPSQPLDLASTVLVNVALALILFQGSSQKRGAGAPRDGRASRRCTRRCRRNRWGRAHQVRSGR